VSAQAKSAAAICPACNTRYEEGGAFCSRDGTPLVKDPQAGKADLVGQVLAERYRIVRLVGEGGMGQVYEAQHVNINKRFALKLLRPEITSNAEAVARFRQEAWSASSIGHENIIEIEDFATLPSGSVYLAMEFLTGLPLSERMREEPPMPFAESLDVTLQVASGLAAAHEKGIVHRDMKPENIFLAQKYGHLLVKILDFGIAKVSGAEGNRSLTRTGTIFGTPHYMSPEQALGKPLDHRADIYSVGVIMYEMFTGKVPFEAESFMGILTKHITTQPKPPREVAPEREIPAEVEALILRSLAKEPEERQQSMADLVNDLAAIAADRAPEVLHPRPASAVLAKISSPVSAVMPARTPRATPPGVPLGPTSAPRTPVPDESHPRLTPTLPEVPSLKKRSTVPWIAMVALPLALGAGAVVWYTRAPHKTVVPPIAVVTPPPPVNPPPVADPPPVKPPAPVMEEVIVDSVPPGAKIFVDGSAVTEAPDVIKVEQGTTKPIVLKKDGFIDHAETLDPAKSHKVLARLERVKKPARPSPPKATAKPSAPASPPPATATTKPAKKHPVDPYERVDDAPPKKQSDVLNPY
jgi:eukaryotic-like serine/threonine-protein kinase